MGQFDRNATCWMMNTVYFIELLNSATWAGTVILKSIQRNSIMVLASYKQSVIVGLFTSLE